MRCLPLLSSSLFAAMAAAASSFPAGPFTTSGRWIRDASGANVNFAGVNWPGAAETMVPEGLQYQSVSAIVSKIKSLGMNSVRLTYAIEMIDQIYENGGSDVPIQKAFADALGQENGTAVMGRVLANNPGLFNGSTTRLQVYDAIAAECARQEIYVYLDNHVSKAKWCCSPLDGNSWWGDTLFSTANWTRGLSFMAEHSKSWPNLMAMSLRNELRQPFTNATLYTTSYNWQSWYSHVKDGVAAIRSANQNVLVLLSGLDSDTTLAPVVAGTALTPGTATFNVADLAGPADKLVLELHIYANIANQGLAGNCSALKADMLSSGGWAAMNVSNTTGVANRMPVLMTEFGWPQRDGSVDGTYESCVRGFLREYQAGWMVWTIAGSYYVREGTQDSDDEWGLLTHDWSSWRSQRQVEEGLVPLVRATLTNLTGEAGSSGGSGTAGSGGKSGAADVGRVGWPVLVAPLLAFCLSL